MKIPLRLIALSVLVLALSATHARAQITSFCDDPPPNDPHWVEPSFQLPIEAGGGVKFHPDGPNPAIGNLGVFAMGTLMQRRLRVGIGPEVYLTDAAPRFLGVGRVVYSFYNLEISSFNNLALGSLNLVGSVHVGANSALLTTVGFSAELGRMLTLGLDWTYFKPEGRSSLHLPITFNPFNTCSDAPPTEPVAVVPSPTDYYAYFTSAANTLMLGECHYYDVARMNYHRDDAQWRDSKSLADLKNYLTNIAVDPALVDLIVASARKTLAFNHVTISNESESSVLHAVLVGFCTTIKQVIK